MAKRIIKIVAWVLVIALFSATFIRIYIGEYYPKEITNLHYTTPLARYHDASPAEFKVYTQQIRIPYDDNKEGNFFTENLLVVPEAEHLQIAVRHSKTSLARCQEFYKLDEELSVDTVNFTYQLYVSYNVDKDGEEFETYTGSVAKKMQKFWYGYDKVVFDGVNLENARWARLDIFLEGQTKIFGSVPVFETAVVMGDQTIEYPLVDYELSKEEER